MFEVMSYRRRRASIESRDHPIEAFRVECFINDVLKVGIEFDNHRTAQQYVRLFIHGASWLDFFAPRPPLRKPGRF